MLHFKHVFFERLILIIDFGEKALGFRKVDFMLLEVWLQFLNLFIVNLLILKLFNFVSFLRNLLLETLLLSSNLIHFICVVSLHLFYVTFLFFVLFHAFFEIGWAFLFFENYLFFVETGYLTDQLTLKQLNLHRLICWELIKIWNFL